MKEKVNFLDKVFPFILVLGGIIGLLASFMLAVDKIQLLKNPDFEPLCSLNPVISCGSVMNTWQAEVFGFPNMLLGLIGFSMVIVVGVSLLAGAKFNSWYWRLFSLGTLFGIIFVHWLIAQIIYDINAICLYCVVVWIVTAPIFWYTLLYALRNDHLLVLKHFKKIEQFAQKHHLDILLLWYVVIAFLVINHFWYYFKTLLP